MFAVRCLRPDPADPIAALCLDDVDEPFVPPGWVTVTMQTASLNMRDVGTLRGTVDADYPTTLGNDGAGTLDDGTAVIVHAGVPSPGWRGPEARDPGRSVLSAHVPGTFAERVAVPAANAVPRPSELDPVHAACLPTAWLTAWRMIVTSAGLRPGDSLLVRGRRHLGSIAVAAVAIASRLGMDVWVVGDPADRDLAISLGARDLVTDVARAPGRHHAALDAAGAGDDLLWAVPGLLPGGVIVCSGYRVGADTVAVDARRLHDLVFSELRVVGSGMGTADELAGLASFLVRTGLRPTVADVRPLRDVAGAIRAMTSGATVGKLVLSIPD